jgi:hypothetical protein
MRPSAGSVSPSCTRPVPLPAATPECRCATPIPMYWCSATVIQAADARPAPDVATFAEVTRPSTNDGQHAPALPFGDPRVMAVMAAVVGFTHLLSGFDNPTLVQAVGTVLGCSYTSRQATYDLRRLKRKELIVRLPGHHRYQLTPLGRRVAVLFTKVYGRVLAPGLATLDPGLPTDLAERSQLALAWRQLDRQLDQFTNTALTAA